MKKLFIILFLSLSVLYIGCAKEDEKTPTGTDGTTKTGKLSFSTKYTQTSLGKMSSTSKISAIDSIKITRARFLLRKIKFVSSIEDSLDFISDPTVIELNLVGTVNTIGVKDIPFGTYKRIEFRVHKLDSAEAGQRKSDPTFKDFITLKDNRIDETYSIIIEGKIFQAGSGTSFIFKSRVNEKQRYDLNPSLVLSENTQEVNVTLIVSSAKWFLAKDGKTLLDPTDKNNENEISDNLKTSIKPVKDNDKDGKGDGN
jgi:hypothetical protein